MTEVEAEGVGYQIDHYVPVSADASLQNVYTNLMHCCTPCNRNKAEYHPSPQQAASGKRFFNPDIESYSQHFEVNQNQIEGTTEVGRFTTEVLMLNRLMMQRVRRARRRLTQDEAAVVSGIHALRKVSVDALPPELKGQFMRIRTQLEAAAAGVIIADNVWQEIVRSRLLDEDPDRAQHLEKRRWALAEAKAIAPSPAKLKPAKPSSAKKKG